MSLQLIAIVGSLRSGSVNGAVARAATELAPTDVKMTVHDVANLPLYNGDDEEAGPPSAAVDLVEAVAGADGLILFSPEYNSSFPAVTKNVIDWLSRPPRAAWEGKPITLATATPGPRAGANLRNHFQSILGWHPVRVFEPWGFGEYGDKLEGGELTDATIRAELADFVARFSEFCQADPEAAE